MDIKRAIEYAKKNPNSAFANELRKRIETGQLDKEMRSAGIGVTTRPQTTQIEAEQPKQPEKKSFIKKAFDFVTKNEQKFGETLGDAMAVQSDDFDEALDSKLGLDDKLSQVGRKIAEKRKAGEDSSGLERTYKNVSGNEFDLAEIAPSTEKSIKQIAGEGLGVATDILGAGSLERKGTQIASKSTGFLNGAWQGAKSGVLSGGAFGAAEGAARAMQEDQTTGGIATSALLSGGIGAASGGLLGAMFGGASGALAKRKVTKELLSNGVMDARTAKLTPLAKRKVTKELLSNGVMDARTAKLTPLGKRDPLAMSAIRQGIDEADVAVIKSASQADKKVMGEMFDIAERASLDRTILDRPMDKAGQTIIKPIKKLEEKLLTESKTLDTVAESLKGQRVKTAGKLEDYVMDSLEEAGASIKDGEIDFTGSDFEDLGGVTKIINNVYKRLTKASDANDLHRIKRYIDTNVEYGQSSEGLVGGAERMLKGWRREIDTALDSQFVEYNDTNTIISNILGQLDSVNSVLGRKFNASKPMAEIKAGQVASRILSNSPNRGEVLSSLNNLFELAKEYGYKSDENFVNQVIFADILEDAFGTQATRSFRGNIERAMESGVMDLAKQGKIGFGETAMKVGAGVYEKVTGKSEEAMREAIKNLVKGISR